MLLELQNKTPDIHYVEVPPEIVVQEVIKKEVVIEKEYITRTVIANAPDALPVEMTDIFTQTDPPRPKQSPPPAVPLEIPLAPRPMSVEVEVKEPELEPPVADTSSLWRNRAMELERMLQDAIEQSVDLHQEISRLSNFKESNEALQRALCGLLWEQELKMNPRGTLMRNDAYGSTEAMRIRRLKETPNAELSIRDMYALVGLENNNLAAVSGKVPATLLALPGAGDPAEDLLTTLNLMDSKHWALYVLGQSAPLNSGWTLGEEVMSRLNTAVSFLPTHWLENGIGASGSTDTGPALQFNHARNVLCEVLSYVLSGQAGDGATLLGENANTPAVGGHIGSQGTSPEKKRAQKSIWEVPKTVNVMDNALHSPRTLPRSDRSVQSLFRHASRVRQISSAHWKVGEHK